MSLSRLYLVQRWLGVGLVLALAPLAAQTPSPAPPPRPSLRGSTAQQVIALYGAPTSRLQAGTKEFFVYPHGGRIGFQGGVVTEIMLPLPPEIKKPEVKAPPPPPPKLPADTLTNSIDKAPADPIGGMEDGFTTIGALVLGLGVLGGLFTFWQKKIAKKAPTLKERFAKAQEVKKQVPTPGGGPAAPAAAPVAFSKKLLEDLEWHYLELLVIGYFDKIGFVAKRVKVAPDGGVDFLLYHPGDEKPTAYAQCKASPAFRIGPKTVRDLIATMEEKKLTEGYYITTNAFTLEALALATGQTLTLMSGADLLAKIEGLSPPDRASLLREMTTGDSVTPTCPNCDIKLLLQKGDKPVWTCRNAPRCEIKMAVRVPTT
jgi:restriction system protein